MANHPTQANEGKSNHYAGDSRLATVTKSAVSIQVQADYGVWDATNNKWLRDGFDYDAKDIFRK